MEPHSIWLLFIKLRYKFKELSPILTVRGASYRVKEGSIVLVSRVF